MINIREIIKKFASLKNIYIEIDTRNFCPQISAKFVTDFGETRMNFCYDFK